jgi:hypothetical protein
MVIMMMEGLAGELIREFVPFVAVLGSRSLIYTLQRGL